MTIAPSTLTDEEAIALADFACTLASAAAKVTLKHFRSDLGVDNKLDGNAFDPVTIADRDAETAIRALIEEHYPDHGILGEEHGVKPGTSPFKWVLDPIDGTRSFISGVPLWGTLIALNDGKYPVVGVMDQPYTGEQFVGRPGQAEFLRDGQRKKLSTRACASLSDAILGCTDPAMFTDPAELNAFSDVRSKARLTRYGTDCYFYCLIAAGHADLVIEASMQPYDIQALIPIVEGAGGIVTNWQGGDAQDGGRIIAAGDKRVHAEALDSLSRVN
ncbi:histidinol-phosphatase [Parvibaculaceae bacterium PLY_AMNH_Bact1]|nr:histidinol-phosphatase [Parvibaculaceae bacterium PLY_AMNH_Bact1]